MTLLKTEVEYRNEAYLADLNQPLDISIDLFPGGPRAWYVSPLRIEAVREGGFNGEVSEGGKVNFRNIEFNPHGHGTHTECKGHISKEIISVNKTLTHFFFVAAVISVVPRNVSGDFIVESEDVMTALGDHFPEALVIRTFPNMEDKRTRNYSNTNFPYLSAHAMEYIVRRGVRHLLVDLPSVDREEDGGALAAHRVFWSDEVSDRSDCTITEMVFVDAQIQDGLYLLNLQMAPFENDASPSRPVLFKLSKKSSH